MFIHKFWRDAWKAFRKLQPPMPLPGIPARYEQNGICARLNDPEFDLSQGWKLSNAIKPTIELFRCRARSVAPQEFEKKGIQIAVPNTRLLDCGMLPNRTDGF
jgi:hypothetical protein